MGLGGLIKTASEEGTEPLPSRLHPCICDTQVSTTIWPWSGKKKRNHQRCGLGDTKLAQRKQRCRLGAPLRPTNPSQRQVHPALSLLGRNHEGGHLGAPCECLTIRSSSAARCRCHEKRGSSFDSMGGGSRFLDAAPGGPEGSGVLGALARTKGGATGSIPRSPTAAAMRSTASNATSKAGASCPASPSSAADHDCDSGNCEGSEHMDN